MTTIAFRAGRMASDSRVSVWTESGGSRVFSCEKLYRKGDSIIGLAGETAPGLLFLDWYGTGLEAPEMLIHGEADFTALVYEKRGKHKGLYEYDRWCRGEKVIGKFYAIGSGAKAALGAMHMGANAEEAVRIACKIDPYSALPVKSFTL